MRWGWAAVCAMTLMAGAALAQGAPIRVTGGEHADFTRIVLQSAAPIAWRLDPDGRGPLVQLSPSEAPIDLSRAFERIPRSRLARIDREGDGIRLRLACDCPIRAFDERPGVVVLDILDPSPADEPSSADSDTATDSAPPGTIPTGQAGTTPMRDTTPMPGAIARRAGRALAQSWPASGRDGTSRPSATGLAGLAEPRLPAAPQPAAPLTQAEQHSLRAALRDTLADAIGTGLLAGADYLPTSTEPANPPFAATHGPGQAAMSAFPSQLRILPQTTGAATPGTAPDRRSADPAISTRHRDPRCRDLDALDFLTEPVDGDFNSALGALIGHLYGEFDRPDAAIRADLIRHYLRFGLGAEARLLIDNARHPVAGSDLLRGLADILEDRPSNARLTLAGRYGCPGIAGLLAALAGPPPPDLSTHGDAIALSYGTLPAPLRRLFGPPLIERLLDDGALDPARMIAEQLHLTGPAGLVAPALPSALIMGGRGAPQLGADSLAAQPTSSDIGAMLARLRLLREAGAQADAALLDEAEALAAGARQDAHGIALMAAAIGHDTARAAHEAGFQRLDRLQRWLRMHEADRQLVAGLADDLWRDASSRADDQTFLSLILAREGWRAAERTEQTRGALAERLLALGLAEPALGLLDPPANPGQSLLRARAMLLRDRPGEAITLLEPLLVSAQDETRAQAGLLMARALRAAGASDAALDAFSALGAHDEAARTAIVRQNWPALADLAREAAAARQAPPAPSSDTASAPEGDSASQAPTPSSADGMRGARDASSPPAMDMLRRLAEAFGSEPPSTAELVATALQVADGEALITTENGADLAAGDDPNDPRTESRAGNTRPDTNGSENAGGTATTERDTLLAGQPIAPVASDSTELPPMLRRNAALIEQSNALRDTIDALLQSSPP